MQQEFAVLAGALDERTRRLVATDEALAVGFGGVAAVARSSGLSRGTVTRGIVELQLVPKPVPDTGCGVKEPDESEPWIGMPR
jgi:hypothetical protein